MSATHEVTNQVPPLIGHDPIAGDAALVEACLRHADAGTLDSLADLGRLAGSEQAQEWGRLANENPPKLRTLDRYGHRVDEASSTPRGTSSCARPSSTAWRAPLGPGRPARPRPSRRRLPGLEAGRDGPRLPGDHDLRRGADAAPHALDVLWATGRSSDAMAAVGAGVELASGVDPRSDDAVERLHAELRDPDQLPLRARRIAGLLALCLQGSLLLRYAPWDIADAFCATRLGGDGGAVLGTLPAGAPTRGIVERAAVGTV